MAIRNYPRWQPELGFDVTGNSAIRSADPENPTLEPNMKCIGSPVADLRILGHMEPPFWEEGEVVGGQRWHHSKERFSYRLSIVTVALYATIRPQFAIECRRSLTLFGA